MGVWLSPELNRFVHFQDAVYEKFQEFEHVVENLIWSGKHDILSQKKKEMHNVQLLVLVDTLVHSIKGQYT